MTFRDAITARSAAAAALALLLAWSGAAAQPKMNIVGGTRLDFGDVFIGSTVKRSLTIRNQGTDTLRLSELSTSCGCTAALTSTDRIAPGDSGSLMISFDSKKFSGTVEKAVTMNTNDTTQRKVRIIFKAHIVRTMELTPEYFFYNADPDSPAVKTIAIKNTSSQNIHILSVKSPFDYFSLALSTDIIRPGETANLVGTVKSGKSGTHNGDVEILTDHPKLPQVNVRTFIYVKERRQ